MLRRYIYLLISFMLVSVATMGQTDRQLIRNGNKLFRQQNYVKAEAEYRKALSKNSRNAQAMYNLGCALMMQKRDSIAVTWLEKSAKSEHIPMRKSKAYHNMGWICQSHRMYAEAIEAYKSSLRINPNDGETRYNLALCKRLLKNNPNKGKNKNHKKNDKSKQKDNKKNKNNSNDNKNDKQQQSQPQQKEKMSKDNAEQLLNAAMQEEQATQQRLRKSMSQPQRRRLEKNW